MAKQAGPLFIRGMINKVCFYRLDGGYYAPSKSSLSGVRVKKDPAFAKTMANAALLKEASSLASLVHRNLGSEKRKHTLYRQMTGAASSSINYVNTPKPGYPKKYLVFTYSKFHSF